MKFIHKIPIFFFGLLYPLKIHGKENIPEGKAVLISNHFHALDCGFVARVYNKDIWFLAKKELFEKKFYSKILKSYGGIPINRENPDMKSLLSAIRVLKDGHKLFLFPEATRNKTGTTELQSIKGGAMVFAVKAKAPIVPMMIDRKLRIFRRSHIIVGKPFELSEFYDVKFNDDDLDKMGKIVTEKMLEQQRILFDVIGNKKKRKKNKK